MQNGFFVRCFVCVADAKRLIGQPGEMSVAESEERQPEGVGVKKQEMHSLVSAVDGNMLSVDLM